MKYDLDRTGNMKEIDKNGKNCMHWNVPPGCTSNPGSATIGPLA